jgi:hypothetical protein
MPAYMTKVLSESSSAIGNMSESYFIPLTEDSIISFINDESKNVKNLKDQYNFQESTTLGIDTKKNLIYFQEGRDILAAYIEDYIAHDLDKYLANL